MDKSCAWIMGGGGHAHVIASFLSVPVRFVVPQPTGSGELSQEQFFAEIERHRADRVYIGIGDNLARRRMFDRLKSFGVTIATCIAPTASIAHNAVLGEGAVICAGAVVGSRAVLGDNVIVNTLSSVDHDCMLGHDVQVTAGVTLAGSVRVGDNGFLGVKAAVIPGVTIGRNVKVMAGSLVAKDLPDDVLAGGNPARILLTKAAG